MKLISHRGNIKGSMPKYENSPNYISQALKLGYEVEVDVRFHKGYFYLGHDKPQYRISSKFLRNKKIWCHAKDINAFEGGRQVIRDTEQPTNNDFYDTEIGQQVASTIPKKPSDKQKANIELLSGGQGK